MIREATLQDAEAIARLMTQLGYPQDAETARGRLQRIAGVVLLFDDGAVRGCIQAGARVVLEAEDFAEILALVVDEDARGKRIGRQLVEAAVAWARERGYAKLRVRTNVTRTDTHRFYENNGFGVLKTQRVYVRDL